MAHILSVVRWMCSGFFIRFSLILFNLLERRPPEARTKADTNFKPTIKLKPTLLWRSLEFSMHTRTRRRRCDSRKFNFHLLMASILSLVNPSSTRHRRSSTWYILKGAHCPILKIHFVGCYTSHEDPTWKVENGKTLFPSCQRTRNLKCPEMCPRDQRKNLLIVKFSSFPSSLSFHSPVVTLG